MNFLCGSYRIETVRADIFPAAGLVGRRHRDSAAAVGAGARYCNAVIFVAVNENVSQIIFKNEGQQFIIWTGDCPSILCIMLHMKTVNFRCCLEALVVIGVSSAAILHTVGMIVVMHHLMKQSGGNMFDRPGKGSGSNVDLMGIAGHRNQVSGLSE